MLLRTSIGFSQNFLQEEYVWLAFFSKVKENKWQKVQPRVWNADLILRVYTAWRQ